MGKSRKHRTSSNNKAKQTLPDIKASNSKTLLEIKKKTSGKCNINTDYGNTSIFPSWTIWLVVMTTLGLRMRYVTDNRNWWILHPDEIYQTIEVAHTEAYGYGFRTYEYLPFSTSDVTNTSIPEFKAQQLRNGMYSLRSFMLPKMLAMFLNLCEFTGIEASPYLTIKILHAVITSFLPMTVMRFVNIVTRSRDQGILAAIFVGASTTLNVLGTHSFINSFLATFMFLSLETLAKCLKTHVTELEENNGYASYKNRVRKHHEIYPGMDISKTCAFDDITDLNANFVNGMKHANDTCVRTKVNQNISVCPTKHVYELAQGFVLGACNYIRIDMILVPIVFSSVLSLRCLFEDGHLRFIAYACRYYLLGISLGILLGGYFDYLYYASWFMSPLQWLRFNVASDKASVIFGSSPSWFYINALFDKEPFTLAIFCVVVSEVVFKCCSEYKSNTLFYKFVLLEWLSHFWSLFMFVCIFILYSWNSHKEMRFVHDGVIFMYICLACAIISVYKPIRQYCVNQSLPMYCNLIIYLFVFLFVSSHLTQFNFMKSNEKSKWTYGGSIDSAEVNSCLNFIGQQDDVSGIFIDRSIYMTGGYSIINRDVPIVALNKYEFVEFDEKTKVDIYTNKLREGKWQVCDNNYAQRIHSFGQISDFISIYNAPYLYKKLINRPEYNYLVLESDREFEHLGGFEEVYRTQGSKVMRRTFDPEAERALLEQARKIPIGNNATILEHEGHWLAHYGLYKLAEERLVFANYLAPREVGPYRRLLEIYKAHGNGDFYSKVLNTCRQFHSVQFCTRPYGPVELHSEYFDNY